MISRLMRRISPLRTRSAAMAAPTPPGARLITALTRATISTISGRAMTIPVRTPGRPSFDRLIQTIVFSFHSGSASVNTMPGNGTPFPNIVFTDAEPLWNENTILCMSLSKLGLPGVRTGIVIARREVVDMVARVNAVMSLAPGGVGPALITDLVRSGEIARIGREIIRPFYERKAGQTLEQIRRYFKEVDYHVHQPEGAFFVWMWFPNLPITSRQLYERLKQRSVIIVPGHYFFPGLKDPWPHANECIRVNYAQDEKIVTPGIQAIAEEVGRARHGG